MARVWLAVGVVLMCAWPAVAQTHIPFGAAARVDWDASTNEAQTFVDVYEARQNGGPTINTGVTVGAPVYSFPLPAEWRVVGANTVEIRACRTTGQFPGCGPWAAVSYIQDPPNPGLPTAPGNPRIVVPPGAQGIAINGVINRLFKEKGLDVAEIAPEGGGQLLVGAAGLRAVSGSTFTVRVGDNAGVVVWRPATDAAAVRP